MISFIIPAHNEEALLPRTLTSVFNAGLASGREFEVIVVDDASADRTAQIASSAGARVLSVNKRQISAVRNAGARAARGDILIFIDADTILPPRTLQSALRAIDRGAVGGGALVAMDQTTPAIGRLCAFLFLLGWMNLFGWAAGCFIFARRDAFEAAGGFDETYFIAEEMYISQALQRVGRFVLLHDRVLTSGRKMRVPGWISRGGKLVLRGPRAFRQREGLELWYDCGRGPAAHDPPCVRE